MDNRCSVCGNLMVLDRVAEKDGKKEFYYTCINSNCKERGKAYTKSGIETESTIKDREHSLFF